MCNTITHTDTNHISLPNNSSSNPTITQYKTLIHEDTSICPECLTSNLFYDNIRAETYCLECGLVTSMPYPWVGGQPIQNPHSYNYYIEETY